MSSKWQDCFLWNCSLPSPRPISLLIYTCSISFSKIHFLQMKEENKWLTQRWNKWSLDTIITSADHMWPKWPAGPKTESGCEQCSCPCGVSQGSSSWDLIKGRQEERCEDRQAPIRSSWAVNRCECFIFDVTISPSQKHVLAVFLVTVTFVLERSPRGVMHHTLLYFGVVVCLLRSVKGIWSVAFITCDSHLKKRVEW